MIVRVEGLSIAFGGVRAVDDVSFGVPQGMIYSIIGPNGAGKTTLFNLISGIYRADSGRVLLEGEDITGRRPDLLAARGISRTFQNLQIFFRMTALENVMVGRHLHENRSLLAHLFRLPAAARQERDSAAEAYRLLERVGLAEQAHVIAGNLPYGALKRLEIARALATAPRLLLLDEPAAGCNAVEAREIDELIKRIVEEGVTVVLVEHNMQLVMRVSSRILVLDYGRRLAEGTVEEVRSDPQVVAAYLGAHGQKEVAGAAG